METNETKMKKAYSIDVRSLNIISTMYSPYDFDKITVIGDHLEFAYRERVKGVRNFRFSSESVAELVKDIAEMCGRDGLKSLLNTITDDYYSILYREAVLETHE